MKRNGNILGRIQKFSKTLPQRFLPLQHRETLDNPAQYCIWAGKRLYAACRFLAVPKQRLRNQQFASGANSFRHPSREFCGAATIEKSAQAVVSSFSDTLKITFEQRKFIPETRPGNQLCNQYLSVII